MKRIFKSTIMMLATFLALRGVAHDSPEHVIDWLTVRMGVVGEDPELLWRRATEYRALDKLEAAGTDLRRALTLKAAYVPALSDLSQVELAQGKRRQALKTINRALDLVPDERDRAPLRMIRAEIFREGREFENALAECDSALRFSSSAEPEWYLTRSQI